MGEEKEYIQRLAVAKCSCGSMDFQYLNLPEDHGVYFQDLDHPMMNALDHVADDHILQFGRCKAPSNPGNIAGNFAGAVIPIFGLAKMLKKAMGCEGCKCSPKTLKVWEGTDEGNCLDGADGILNKSMVQCFYGGQITITKEPEPEKKGKNSQDSNDSNSKKSVLERMPAEMAAKVQGLNESPGPNPSVEAGEAASGGTAGTSGSAGASVGASGGAGGAGPSGISGAAGSGQSGSGYGMSGLNAPSGTAGMLSRPETGMSAQIGGGLLTGGISTFVSGSRPSFSKMLEQELLNDMTSWYEDHAEDFLEEYGVSEAVSLYNYANNMRQAIPPACMNPEGLICDLSGLSAFRMGGGSAEKLGAACAASYNVLRQLGETPSISGIILAAEKQQTVAGFMDQGPMAVGMSSMRDYFGTLGFDTKLSSPQDFCTRQSSGTFGGGQDTDTRPVAVLGTSIGGKASFATIRTAPGGRMCCAEKPELPVERLFAAEAGQPKLMMEISRKNTKKDRPVMKSKRGIRV